MVAGKNMAASFMGEGKSTHLRNLKIAWLPPLDRGSRYYKAAVRYHMVTMSILLPRIGHKVS